MKPTFFSQLDEIRSVLSTSASVEDKLQCLRPFFEDADVARELWKQLDDSKWIALLQAEGQFSRPPATVRMPDDGLHFPMWPASKFLARVAVQAPGEVADIFAGMKTDNKAIIADMLDAASAMPAGDAASLVPTICRAAKEGTVPTYSPSKPSDLCVRLAQGNQIDAAMQLADALFTPAFDKGQEKPKRRVDHWYTRGLKEVAPALVNADATKFLPRLCDWLKVAVDAKERVDPETGSDQSYSWRPAIEEHGQNHDYDFAGVMVGFVRAGFEQAIRSNALTLEDAIQIVKRYRYLVFKRIRLHLICEFAEQKPDLARETMLDHSLFVSYKYKHEYARLVGKRLDMLSVEQQKQWFGWVDAGPDDIEQSAATFKTLHGREMTEEERTGSIAYWKFSKLHLVRKYITGKWKTSYETMLGEHGEPELADMNVRSTVGWGGIESPMTVADLTAKTFKEAVEAVSVWKPEKSGFDAPDVEGLAATFKQYVATNPEGFSAKAMVLVDRPVIFVVEFVRQMGEAVKDGRDVDLDAVLALCRRIVDRPVSDGTTTEQGREDLEQRNWRWCQSEVLRLVENVCMAKDGNAPKYALDTFRQPLWQLIAARYRDQATSNATREFPDDDPRVCDYLNRGINSARGRTMEAALEYARWVANHRKKVEGDREIVEGGFKQMPKFRKMLEWQLAPGNRTVEVMSIIGSRIGLILWIDKKWLTEHAAELFNLKGIEEESPVVEGWAAWNAFLVWVRPHSEFYRVFRPQFAYAVDQAAEVQLPDDTHEQPMYSLGEHLMILYGRGQLELGEDGDLLGRFLTKAQPAIRMHAVEFVGRTLRGLRDDEEVPEAAVTRFQALWETYWGGPGKKDAVERPDVSLFGEWFSCGRFPVPWAMDCLEEFVSTASTADFGFMVAEKLSEYAQAHPEQAVRILDGMVRGDREGWQIHSWIESATKILGQAMNSPGEAHKQAVALIDYLGRRGFIKLGELLKKDA